jgi:ankyrin repeat protein
MVEYLLSLEGWVEYLLSLEGGASIAETDDEGNTALLLAVGRDCYPSIVQWLLEHGGAQITDTNYDGDSV